jgi:hypothetical protein
MLTLTCARIFESIRSGEIVVLGTELPYFMYRDGYIFNPDDMEDGLLEGHALFAVSINHNLVR